MCLFESFAIEDENLEVHSKIEIEEFIQKSGKSTTNLSGERQVIAAYQICFTQAFINILPNV